MHQAPLSLGRVSSTDRNFYDRNYFNAHDRTGDIFLISGFGVYPNLSVVDAFVTVRHGDSQVAVRFSDALGERSMESKVGGYRLEVIEPLQKIRVICEHEQLSCDITWDGSFPAVLEEAHILMSSPRPILDASRFAQVGSWSGTLAVQGKDVTLDPHTWMARATARGGASVRSASRIRRDAGPTRTEAATTGHTCRCASTTSR